MARVVVEVVLKPEVADPQGQTVAAALPRLGLPGVRSVRQGKLFVLDLEDRDGDDPDALLARAGEVASTLLANPVVEDWTVRLDEPAPVSSITSGS